MDDTERRTAKRSRFDQKEPEPRKVSRFDRRSRSPPARNDDSSARDRSPLSRDRDTDGSPATKSPIDPAAAAGKARRRNKHHAHCPTAIPAAGKVSTDQYVPRVLTSASCLQPPLPPRSTPSSRHGRASSMSTSLRSAPTHPRPPRPVLRAERSTVRCTSRTVIISRTSKSTICGTDIPSPRDLPRKW